MAANNITRLVELAARAYLKAAIPDEMAVASIHGGFDDDEIPTPRVVCTCNQAEPDGNADNAVWACSLEIKVVNNADDKNETEHHDTAGAIFAYFMVGRYTTAQALADAYDGFDCQDILPTGQTKDIVERRWVSVLTMRVVCSGADIGNIAEEETTLQWIPRVSDDGETIVGEWALVGAVPSPVMNCPDNGLNYEWTPRLSNDGDTIVGEWVLVP